MELNEYIRLFQKWAWLVVGAALIGAAIAYFVRNNQPDVYQTQTKMLVGSYLETSNPSGNDIQTGGQLARIYIELAETRPVLEDTISALNLDMSVGELRAAIEPSMVTDTSFVILKVTDKDPERAALIANTLADQLIAHSPSNPSEEDRTLVEEYRSRISDLNGQIATLDQQMADTVASLQTSQNPEEITNLRMLYDISTAQRGQLQTEVADLRAQITGMQPRANSITVVEPAIAVRHPVNKGTMRMAFLGGLVGVLLASALVLFIDYRQTTVESAEELSTKFGLPILGAVARFGRRGDTYAEHLVARLAPGSPIAETYQTVQTNLLFASSSNGHMNGNGTHRRKGIYVLTSPGPGEGKSTTTANLAVTMAAAGMKVLLIDADLRQPRLHELLGLTNRGQLAHLLTTSPTAYGEITNVNDLPEVVLESVQMTDITNLWVITSGPLPDVPAEVLNSAYLQDWMRIFTSLMGIDVVLFDTPPCLMVADSSILAANLHAKVVLVVEAGRTQLAAVRRAKAQFEHIGCEINGVILNRANVREMNSGYGNHYYKHTAHPAVKEEI
jgi:capsular exopolysaccharide synthesis family protein